MVVQESVLTWRPASWATLGDSKKDRRDNQVIWQLVNWGHYVRAGMAGIPKEYPLGASWHQQITDSWPDENDQPVQIDEDAGQKTQDAIVRCMSSDMETAMILVKHYRDGWQVTSLRSCRNRFWKYL